MWKQRQRLWEPLLPLKQSLSTQFAVVVEVVVKQLVVASSSHHHRRPFCGHHQSSAVPPHHHFRGLFSPVHRHRPFHHCSSQPSRISSSKVIYAMLGHVACSIPPTSPAVSDPMEKASLSYSCSRLSLAFRRVERHNA